MPRVTAAGIVADGLGGELKAYRDMARLVLTPATDAQVGRELDRLFSHYPRPDHSADAEAGRWADWMDDLADMPHDLLSLACQKWRRSTARWSPTPGQLRAQVEGMLAMRKAFLRRAEEALALAEAA